jgi:zinc protease
MPKMSRPAGRQLVIRPYAFASRIVALTVSASLAGILLVPAASLFASGASAQTPKHPDELVLKALAPKPLDAEQVTLPCGIPVVLYASHDLPILDLTIQFKMGTRYLPAERHTACGLLGDLWRDGGTTSIAPDSLDAVLTALDASVNAGIWLRTGGVSISLSREDVERALPLWRDVVTSPGFNADRLVRAKANRLQELQAINNDPGAIADKRLSWLVYGKDFPTSRQEMRSDIEGVTVEDLRALHQRFVRPENALIGVSGDFDRTQMLALLDRLFRDWKVPGPYEPPVTAPWIASPEPGVYLLRGDYAQSQIRAARIVDLTDTSPDYAPANLLSSVLGYQRVFYRTREEGLSYGTYVSLNVGPERTLIRGGGSGRGDATLPLLRAVLEETKRMAIDPATTAEMQSAKVSVIGTEIQTGETPAALVQRTVGDILLGRPKDFRPVYLERVQAAASGDLSRLTNQYLAGSDWVILVLGNPDQFGGSLESLGLGPVRELAAVKFGE